MDAPDGRRAVTGGRAPSARPSLPALAGGRVPSPLRRATAAVTLLTLLPVSYFVASLAVARQPVTHAVTWNVPLLAASVLIGALAIATARRLTDRRPASPWLAAATLLPTVATLHSTGLI